MGGEAYQVTDALEGVGSYRVAPDGTHLAYTMTDPASETWTDAQREKRDVIVADQDFRYSHLYMGSFGSGMEEHAHRVTEGNFTVTGWDWSPTGDAIVFAHQSDPRLNTASLDGDLSVVDTRAHEGEHPFPVRPLVAGPGVEANPHFSPDGRWIAFSSNRAGGGGNIFAVKPDGTGLTKLTETLGSAHRPHWGRDGWIYFDWTERADGNGNSDIWRFQPLGELAGAPAAPATGGPAPLPPSTPTGTPSSPPGTPSFPPGTSPPPPTTPTATATPPATPPTATPPHKKPKKPKN
jgi:Tol biopolymer transport system component